MTILPTLRLGAPYTVAAFAVVQREDKMGGAPWGVALLSLPANDATPFVTYRIDHNGNCFWGHYHADEHEAWGDYQDRLNDMHRRAMRVRLDGVMA
jgi:hypothetical protein